MWTDFSCCWSILITSPQLALCNQPMRELSNPGASGSLFYLSADDEFIVKTVQKKEAKFLQKLLPGYYLVSFRDIFHPCLPLSC